MGPKLAVTTRSSGAKTCDHTQTVDETFPEAAEVVGESVRRVLYVPTAMPIAVTVLADPFGEATAIGVTALSTDVEIEFPLRNTGGFGSTGQDGTRFRTHLTTLDDAVGCIDSASPFGSGASWVYFAVGCGGYGVNNFDANAIAVNYGAAGISTGLGRIDLAEQLLLDDRDLKSLP